MTKKNPLAEGIVGRELVNYFSINVDETNVPVDAESLSLKPGDNPNKDQVQYRITFEDGSVSDWLVTFESGLSFEILSAEQFNEVL